MPTWDVIATVQNVLSLVLEGTQLGMSLWLISGGLMFLIRNISFIIDLLLINFIGAVYTWFDDLLNGTMFNTEVTNAVMKNIYIFIGVIVFFRLMMVLLKYIVNPELVNDGKVGASNLIKRVIIGMAGIILIPTIFSVANDFQSAFLKDQVIQKILVPEDLIETTKNKVGNAGRYIGTYVLAGFINPSSKASPGEVKAYDLALSKGDLSSIDINAGGFMTLGWSIYKYNYFFFLSTFVLGYVLFLMLKYCLDLVTRLFKLFIYQLLAPVAMIEYMINGSQDGVFKNWRTAVLSTYCMLFIRVFALWFVVFVMTLMSGDLPDDTYVNGSLLNKPDYLLRAIIIVALLAFMMDLPKIVGNIFGLDLEQEGSATGLLNSIKGGFTKIAGAGLTMGGAMVGGAIGAAKGGLGSLNALGANKTKAAAQNATGAQKKKLLKTAAGLQARADKLGTFGTTGKDALKGVGSSMIKAGMNSNQFTQAAYSGYTSVGDTVKGKADKRKAEQAQEIQEAREQARDEREIARDRRQNMENIYNSPAGKSMTKDQLHQASVESEINAKLSNVDLSAVAAELDALISKGSKVKVAADLVSKEVGNTLNVAPQQVKRIVQDVYDDSNIAPPDKAQRIVDEVRGSAFDTTMRETEVIVNQVYGNRVMDNVSPVTQTVNQEMGQQVSNVTSNATQTVNQTVGQRTSTNAPDVNQTVYQDVVRRNHQINDVTVNEQRNINTKEEKTVDIRNNRIEHTLDAKYFKDALEEANELTENSLGRDDEEIL